MKFSAILLTSFLTLFLGRTAAIAGEAQPGPASNVTASSSEFEPPRFEFATETAYILSFAGNPNSYEIGAQFFTGRVRWGVNRNPESIFRGYNQFYFLAMAEPIFRGIENHYFGISTGLRYVFVRPGWRIQPYISGGFGLGWIDSSDQFRQGQGQDFTFNVLTQAGLGYLVNDHWKLNIGALYQHLSNGGQTDPNPSLNLIGPQIGVTYSF